MQPTTTRLARARLSLISLLLVFPLAQPVSADPAGGDYQGWIWETGVFWEPGIADLGTFSEEQCFAPIHVPFASDLNFTISVPDEVCWGRSTTSTGRSGNNLPPFATFTQQPDESTQPLVSAGGNLYELYGEEFEQGVGLGEERLSALLSLASNDNLLMAGGYFSEEDQFSLGYFRYIDLFVKSTDAIQAARTEANLDGTAWRVATYSHELLDTDVDVEFSQSTIATLNLQSFNQQTQEWGCSFSDSVIFPEFVDNGDVYRAFQFDGNVNFDDRFVSGGPDERDLSNCTWSIDADEYLTVTQTVTRALDTNNPVTFTTRFVVSDDNRHLVLAPATVTEDSARSLTLGYRAASQLANNAIDDTYFIFLAVSEFGADGAGAAAAGFGPRDWQELDLIGRGKVVFDSTTPATTPAGETGNWYACSMEMALGEIEYGLTGSPPSVALSTFTADSDDLQFDDCDFQLAADGGLSIRLFLVDGEDPGDNFEIILRGYVNDNAEIMSVTANSIDGDPLNPTNVNKDVATVFFVLGMEYTGDPDADADGDGFTNYEEFKIPLPFFRILDQDTDGNGTSDILLRNNVSGDNQLYLMNGTTITQNLEVENVSDDWKAVGRGDYDGDGNADILWRYTPTGALWIYFMNGNTKLSSKFVGTVSDPNWKIVGSGDYDGDGKSDILWRLTTTGTVWLYEMDGNIIKPAPASRGIGVVPDLNWKIVGSGDYNGDGRSDILWRNVANNANWMYLMNGAVITADAGISVTTDLNWEVVGNGDYNGDGNSDILWRNAASGTNWVYLMDGLTILVSDSISVLPDLNWKVVGDGDYNGDGFADVLWRNVASGTNYMYLMNGLTISNDSANVSVVTDQNWAIVNTP